MKIQLTFDSIEEMQAFIRTEAARLPPAKAPPKSAFLMAFEKVHPHIPLTEEQATEIRQLQATNYKIQAIKALRTATNLGLKEAKEFLDLFDT